MYTVRNLDKGWLDPELETRVQALDLEIILDSWDIYRIQIDSVNKKVGSYLL